MTRFRNVKLGFLDNIKTEKLVSKRKIWDRKVLRNFQSSKKFQLSNFTLTWSNQVKMNSVWPDMTYSKEL